MKKISLYILLLATFAFFSSCNDEWEDELYQKMVSFRAPLDSDGVCNIYLRYNADGVVSYNLPVIVSGSKTNDQNIYVKIATDNDTLGILNIEKFQFRTDLFFKQLPDSYYKLPASVWQIPAGNDVVTYPIEFKLNDLDLVDKWVLPLTIEDDPSYITNKRKGLRKALLKINLYNDYSGTYSATATNIYFDGETTNPAVVDSRRMSVVDEQSIFFYAGSIWEEGEDRGKYKIIARFGEGIKNADGSINGSLTLFAPNSSEIEFQQIGEATYTVIEGMDPTLPYIKHRYVTLKMEYKYTDITSAPGNPIRYRVSGTMTMGRDINTLISDESQAINW